MMNASANTIETPHGSIVINPGTGSVEGTSEKWACENITHLLTDVAFEGLKWVRLPKEDERGRYGFLLWQDRRCCVVQMPGLPLHQVRWMKEEGQDIWQFPRLYVDYDSWVWFFAIGRVRSVFTPDDEE